MTMLPVTVTTKVTHNNDGGASNNGNCSSGGNGKPTLKSTQRRRRVIQLQQRRHGSRAPLSNGSGMSIDDGFGADNYNNVDGISSNRRQRRKRSSSYASASDIICTVGILAVVVVAVQLVCHSVLYNLNKSNNGSSSNNNHILERVRYSNEEHISYLEKSYDVLLKNTINYNIDGSYNSIGNNNQQKNNNIILQQQINNLNSQVSSLESQLTKYVDDPRFFPFVIRDSRHLTPTQIDHDFHIFDYVDLTQAKQPKSKHSQLFHNARLVYDEILEEKRKLFLKTAMKASEKQKLLQTEPNEAPCQFYSVKCYRQKIIQVFSYVLRHFPHVEFYFYMEADNDLCVPMSMVKDLALSERRYFINTGIGFSGWVMSRSFLQDFLTLYSNITLDVPITKIVNSTTNIGETVTIIEEPEIRPDVLASYYLMDRQEWSVTRQYLVSHTTLESLGIASLTVKDRRKDDTGERMKLDKHLPRCLEPRRGKWKVSRQKPYDPRDRFGWDYFDYDECPDELIFPCGGSNQLKELIAKDWKTANETGALAKWKRIEELKKKKEEEKAKKEQQAAKLRAVEAKKAKINEELARKQAKVESANKTNVEVKSTTEI